MPANKNKIGFNLGGSEKTFDKSAYDFMRTQARIMAGYLL